MEYIKHILASAKQARSDVGLNQVIANGNRSWHLKELKRSAELYDNFIKWEQGKSFESLREDFTEKALGWASATNDIDRHRARLQYVRYTLANLLNAPSSFDLFVIEKYFDLVSSSQTRIDEDAMLVDRKWQMTDWRSLEIGLSGGSLDYLSTFLQESSYETDRKIVLLKVLSEMEKSSFTSFTAGYQSAFSKVKTKMPAIPAPAIFATDLHIFTVSGYRGVPPDAKWPRGLLWNPSAQHILTSWNSQLGRVESNVIDSRELTDEKSTVVSMFPQIQPLVSRYFDSLRAQKGTLTESQVNVQETRELETMLARSTFFISMERGRFSKDDFVSMSRIFFGGPLAMGSMLNPQPKIIGLPETFIERDFPKLRLAERKAGVDVHELGRLLSTDKAAPNTRIAMVKFMSDYLLNTGARGSAILDGGAGASMMYQRMGAQVVAGPEQLGLPTGYKPVWVLSVPISKMTYLYAPKDYDAVQLRETPKVSRNQTDQ